MQDWLREVHFLLTKEKLNLLVVKGGPHCITWTHAEEVNRELVDFLATTS